MSKRVKTAKPENLFNYKLNIKVTAAKGYDEVIKQVYREKGMEGVQKLFLEYIENMGSSESDFFEYPPPSILFCVAKKMEDKICDALTGLEDPAKIRKMFDPWENEKTKKVYKELYPDDLTF